MNNKSYKYPLLNDKEWLYEKYVKEELSTARIYKLAGAKTANSVRQALIRHSIPVRSVGDGLRCNNSDGIIINKEVIDGCLLGDGFLIKWNKESNKSYPYFAKRNKYYDHIKYVSQILFKERWKERVKESDEKSLGKRLTVFILRSLSNKKLLSFYMRWYPEWNDYKKVIPKDVDISPASLLNWFLDDGNSYQRRKDSSTKQVVITMCSECFSKEDQQMIVDKIYEEHRLGFKVVAYSHGTGWRIRLPQAQTSLFYDVIGPCPVASMEYKWK